MHSAGENPRVEVIHRVVCRRNAKFHEEHRATCWFFDTPRLFAGDNKQSQLRGKIETEDFETYLAEYFGQSDDESESDDEDEDEDEDAHDDDDDDDAEEKKQREDIKKSVIAVVERSYDCIAYHERVKESFEQIEFRTVPLHIDHRVRHLLFVLNEDGPEASRTSERMEISNSTLLSTLRGLPLPDNYRFVDPIFFPKASDAPYLPFYHLRENIKRKIADLEDQILRTQLVVLLQYILESCKDDYAEADALFSEGLVNQKHFPKLIRPNEVLLEVSAGHTLGYLSETLITRDGLRYDLRCWSWSYDGVFRRTWTQLAAVWPDYAKCKIEITSLKVYPLRFATPEMQERIEKRGRRVWDCRRKVYVSYNAPNLSFDVQMANPRFMVDRHIYNELHLDPDETNNDDDTGGLTPEELEQDDPPDAAFVLLLPETVVGYGFHDKKWKTLHAEYITDIDWQIDAFERLVLDQNKKDIIKALVSVHVSTSVVNEPNDIIEGKGNGLILLLHGSPGTGKTLTAESIAELTKKPLYRVTCGDVGIEPESVEKYLDSVLYIGTVWGCVVLLDEADIFLEERTQADLQRNALVSVFLRVLEYYNGILILTTNRVGIFDEAFKSRIQLSIHYPPLDLQGRLEIWLNFFNAMKEDEHTDLMALKRKADLLARYRINGRQIRNTVKSARQVAYYKTERLDYSHFDRVIRIADEFDRYIEKAHGGNTDEEWARDSHTRA